MDRCLYRVIDTASVNSERLRAITTVYAGHKNPNKRLSEERGKKSQSGTGDIRVSFSPRPRVKGRKLLIFTAPEPPRPPRTVTDRVTSTRHALMRRKKRKWAMAPVLTCNDCGFSGISFLSGLLAAAVLAKTG